jgi:hypothetical protein
MRLERHQEVPFAVPGEVENDVRAHSVRLLENTRNRDRDGIDNRPGVVPFENVDPTCRATFGWAQDVGRDQSPNPVNRDR